MQTSEKRLISVVALAAFLAPFTQTIYVPILPELGAMLDTTHFLINVSISVFTFVLAVMQIVYGPLVDRHGVRRFQVVGLSVYVGATLGCFLSPNIELLLLFRALQALGISACAIVAITAFGEITDEVARRKAVSLYMMMLTLGPILGPVIGGFVGEHFSPRFVFLLLLLVGLAALYLNYAYLPDTESASRREPTSYWSGYAVVLRDRRGLCLILLGFIQFYGLYTLMVFLPRILDERFSLDASQKGLMFLPLSIGTLLGSIVVSRLIARVNMHAMLKVAMLANLLSFLLFIPASHYPLSLLVVVLLMFGIFLGASSPVQVNVMAEIYRSNRATAQGMYNFFRFFGMSLAPVIGTWLFNLGGIPLLFGGAGLVFLAAVVNASRQLQKST